MDGNTCQITNFFTTNPFFITGLVLSVIWVGSYFLSWAIQWLWSWVDETPTHECNYVLRKVATMFGYEYTEGGHYNYYKVGTGDDGEIIFIKVLGLIWLGVFSVMLWYISMWLVLATTIAFMARSGRRTIKLFKAHTKDKEAHK